jgi:hypothetical protein|tara:strand:+ start:250 stop:618 length:369 start_codon:yes stop_codon:yes gene_type:complete
MAIEENRDLETLEEYIINLGNDIYHFCEYTEVMTEERLLKIEKEKRNLKNLSKLDVMCLHSLYLRIIGYALIKSIQDCNLANDISKKLGVDLIQEELKNGVDVPNEVVDSMLDEMNKINKDK